MIKEKIFDSRGYVTIKCPYCSSGVNHRLEIEDNDDYVVLYCDSCTKNFVVYFEIEVTMSRHTMEMVNDGPGEPLSGEEEAFLED